MRVIYLRLLISGALLAALLVLGTFGPMRGSAPADATTHVTAGR